MSFSKSRIFLSARAHTGLRSRQRHDCGGGFSEPKSGLSQIKCGFNQIDKGMEKAGLVRVEGEVRVRVNGIVGRLLLSGLPCRRRAWYERARDT
jgi:hypothetical protein